MAGLKWVPGVGVVWRDDTQEHIAAHNGFIPSYDAFRFYADDATQGDGDDATPLQDQDVDHTLDLSGGNGVVLLRSRIQETGGDTDDATHYLNFQYEINDSGTWVDILDSSAAVRLYTSSTLTDDANPNTELLTGGSGSFETTGVCQETSGSSFGNAIFGINQSNRVECMWALEFVESQFSNGDTVDFRARANNSDAAGTVIGTRGRITISKGNAETVAATMTGSATVSKVATFFQTLAATLIGTATLAKVATFFRTVAATMIGSAAIAVAKTVSETIAATMTGSAAVAFVKSVTRALAATLVGAATTTFTRPLTNLTVAATNIGSATVNKIASFFRTVAATMTGVATATFTRPFTNLTLAATNAGIAALANIVTRFVTLAATMIGSAALSRLITFFRTIEATMVGSASLTNDQAAAGVIVVPNRPGFTHVKPPLALTRGDGWDWFWEHCVGAYFPHNEDIVHRDGAIIRDRSRYGKTATVDNSSGDITREITERGKSFVFSGDATNDRINLGSIGPAHPLYLGGNTKISCVAGGRWDNTVNSQFPRIFDKSTAGSGINGYFLGYSTSSVAFWFSANESGTGETRYDGSYSLSAGEEFQIGFNTSEIGVSGQFYLNGQALSTTLSTNPTTVIPAATANMAIGNWNHATDRMWGGPIHYVYIFDEAAPSSFFKKINADPYGPFRRRSKETVIITGAAGPSLTELTLAAINATSATVNRVATFFRTVAAIAVNNATVAIGRLFTQLTLAATNTGNAALALIRIISVAATMVGSATISSTTKFFRTVAATMIGSAAVVVGRLFTQLTLAATNIGVATVVASAAEKITLAATMTGNAALTFIRVITVAATMIGSATVSFTIKYARTIAATLIGLATQKNSPMSIIIAAEMGLGNYMLANIQGSWDTLAGDRYKTVGGGAPAQLHIKLFETLAATMTGVASVITSTIEAITLAATMVGNAALTFTRPFTQLTLAAVNTAVAVLNRTLSLFKTLAATMVGVAAVNRVAALLRVLAATMIGSATLNRTVALFRTVAATMIGSATVIVGRLFTQLTLAATNIGAATLSRVATLFRTLAATMVGNATLNRTLSLFVTLAATMIGVTTVTAGRLFTQLTVTATNIGVAILNSDAINALTLAATMAGNAALTLTRPFTQFTLAATNTVAAAINFVVTFFRTLAATMTGVATLNRVATFFRTIAATMIGVATVAANALGGGLEQVTLAATATMNATVNRVAALFRTVTATMIGNATVQKIATFLQTIAATMVGVATVQAVAIFLRTIAATMIGVATLNRQLSLFRTLAATMTGNAAVVVGRLFTQLTLAATNTVSVSLTRAASLFRTLAATMTGVAGITATQLFALTTVTLAATMTGLATIATAVTRFVEPFTGHGGLGLGDARTRWRQRARTWRARR